MIPYRLKTLINYITFVATDTHYGQSHLEQHIIAICNILQYATGF